MGIAPHPRTIELDGLMELAHDSSTAARARLVRMVGDLFLGTAEELNSAERDLMIDILRKLIAEVEASVRATLAEKLADAPDMPRELIVDLANDDEDEVAWPILLRSKVLQDPDLIEVVRHRSMRHRLAISMREQVSEAVSDALVEKNESLVIRSLIENAGACLSKGTVDFLVEESRSHPSLREPLLHRRELPPQLAARMYGWVSAAMRRHIVDRYDIDEATLDNAVDATVEDLVEEVREGNQPGGAPVDLADLLAHADALSPRLLIELLREGQIPLFESIFAEMAGLNPETTRRILYHPGGETLAIVCRAIAVSKSDFASILLLSRQARPGDQTVESDELTRCLALFDSLDQTVARRTLGRFRLDPGSLPDPDNPGTAAGPPRSHAASS